MILDPPSKRLAQQADATLKLYIEKGGPKFGTRQDQLYQEFVSRALSLKSNTYRFCIQALARTASIPWEIPDAKVIHNWQKKDIGNYVEKNPLNCWMSILYCAFQADIFDKKQCFTLDKAFRSHVAGDNLLETLRKGFGAVDVNLDKLKMGDILFWYRSGKKVASTSLYGKSSLGGKKNKATIKTEQGVYHIVIYLGKATIDTRLGKTLAKSSSVVPKDFIWQNSGLSSWGIIYSRALSMIAPFPEVKRGTKGTLHALRPWAKTIVV